MCKSNFIKLKDLPEELQKFQISGLKPEINFQDSFKEAKRKILERFERTYLQNMLETSKGVVSRAAKKAGMHEKNFREKLKYYHLHP